MASAWVLRRASSHLHLRSTPTHDSSIISSPSTTSTALSSTPTPDLPTTWTITLPTLVSVFPAKRSRLSLDRLSLSALSFGLKTPSLPSASLLAPLLSLLPSEQDPAPSPTPEHLTAALNSFRTYITRFKAAATHNHGTSTAPYFSNDKAVAVASGHLLAGYLAVAVACAHFLNSASATPTPTHASMAAQGVKEALEAIGVLYHALEEHPESTCESAVHKVHRALLSTPFGGVSSPAPLLAYTSALAARVASSARIADPEQRRRRSSSCADAYGEDAPDAALSAIKTFINFLAAVPTLPLQEVDEDEEIETSDEERERWPQLRPRQVEIEARLAACELALSLALVAIEAVKLEEGDGEQDGGEEGRRGEACEEEVLGLLLVAEGLSVDELLESLDRDAWLGGVEAGEHSTEEGEEVDSGNEGEDDSDEEEGEDSDELELVDDGSEEDQAAQRPALVRIGEVVERLAEFRSTVYDAVLKDVPGAPRRREYALGRTIEAWDRLGRRLVAVKPKVAAEMFPGEVDRWLELEARRRSKRLRSGSPSEGGGKRVKGRVTTV